MATITTRAGKGTPLTNTEVDNNFTNLNTDKIENVVEDTTPQLGGNLDLNSNDITGTGNINVTGTVTASGEISANGGIALGDNDKVTFGAGDDLEIYHDGNHSYIKDSGTGDLRFLATNLIVNNGGDTQNMFKAIDGGAVTAYYNGSAKVATTSTGIDVTGSVTADGLTVDSSSSVISTFNGTAATGINVSIKNTEHEFYIGTNDGNLYLYDVDNTATRFNLASNGDISFYEDTGATAKFFWDASAEGLNIGASSEPYGKLDISDVGGTGIPTIFDAAVGDNYITSGSSGITQFRRGSTNTVRIDGLGNVGIGTTSPDAPLTVQGGSATAATIQLKGGALGNDNASIHSLYNLYLKADSSESISGRNMIFQVGSTEGMRIDSSGNLLVGTTDGSGFTTSSTNSGVKISDGIIAVNGAGGSTAAGYFNVFDDGTLQEFRKDGATVGSIGTRDSGALEIGSGDVYLQFNGANDWIKPVDGSGSNKSGVDLGTSGAKFDNLYLSGTAYIGDTDSGSAGTTGKNIQSSQDFSTVYSGSNATTWAGMQLVNHDDTSNRTSVGLSFVHRSSSSGIAGIQSTSDAGDRADIRFSTRSSGGVAERMILDYDGNVGIGTTPSGWTQFDVIQMSNGANLASYTAGTGQTHLGYNNYWNGSNYKYVVSDEASRYIQVSGEHRWETAPSGTAGNNITFSRGMTLDASGNLYSQTTTLNVGTSSTETGMTHQAGQLQVSANGYQSAIFNRLQDGTIVDFRVDGSVVGSIGSRSSGTALQIYTSSTGIDFGGDGILPMVGSTITDASRDIGSSSYRFKDLYLSGKTHYGVAGQTYYQVVKANGDGLYIGADDGSTGGTGADIRFNIKADEKMRILNSGAVVIGRTSTGSPTTDYGFNLYNTGQLYIYSSSSGNSDVIRGYDSSGANTFAIDGDGDYINLSDQRKKENIADIQIGLAEVMQLQPRQFDWIDSGEHVPSGFVAQEVQSIIPSAVVENDDGFLMMKDRQLIPVLTKALQEAVARIETLEAEVATLKGN